VEGNVYCGAHTRIMSTSKSARVKWSCGVLSLKFRCDAMAACHVGDGRGVESGEHDWVPLLPDYSFTLSGIASGRDLRKVFVLAAEAHPELSGAMVSPGRHFEAYPQGGWHVAGAYRRRFDRRENPRYLDKRVSWAARAKLQLNERSIGEREVAG